MKVYSLERQQFLPGSLESVFAFFARAENLERITPPWLGFRIQTALPIEIEKDTRIDYAIKLGGIPMGWRTWIQVWEPPFRFIDYQERGPYTLWEHTHMFEAQGDGVLMTDVVRYALPFGPLGQITHALVVRALLARIFDHRYAVMRDPGALVELT